MRLRLTVILAAALPSVAGAEWTPLEVIDSPVTEISPAQGNSVVSDGERWYVTYVKDGDVWIRIREGGVWQTPMAMESDPSVAVSPQLGTARDGLVVLAWEDDRSGHAEIYTRTLLDGVWTPEACLACDSVPSRSPAMSHGAGFYSGDAYSVYLVWAEGAPGSAVIQLADRDDDGWSDTRTISMAPGGETPTVAAFAGAYVAWIDDRSGSPALMVRYDLDDEQIVDIVGGGTPENPSIHYEYCCDDIWMGTARILLEDGASSPARVLQSEVSVFGGAGDAHAHPFWFGTGVSVDGFQFRSHFGCHAIGGSGPVMFHVRSTVDAGIHTTVFSGTSESEEEVLTSAGLTPAAIGGVEGKPQAQYLAMWIEEVEGTPTLVGRVGGEVGGTSYEIEEQVDFVLVAPEGVPANQFRLIDGYSGEPHTDYDGGVRFTQALGSDLTLDGTDFYYEAGDVNPDGTFEVAIPGGGCSQAGTGDVTCVLNGEFGGVKSPDIDGDCFVDDDDLAYVEARLGTDDYCADLDGSGVVDAGDVSIVEATLGDACAFVDVPEGATAPTAMFRVDRNPFRARTTLRLVLPGGATRVEVHDVNGRRVRLLADALAVGGHEISFDGRDDAGHALAAGTYFVTVTTPGRTLHERLTLLR